MAVFVCLQANKEKSQCERQKQPQFELAALVELERPMRPSHGHARGEQYKRVDRRQTPGTHGRELLFDTRSGYRPSAGKVWPYQFMLHIGEPGNRKYAHVIQRAEKRGKKHHLGEDKPAHPPAERCIDLLVEFAAFALPRHLAEPDENHVEEYGKADRQQPVTDRVSVYRKRSAKTHE